MNIDWSFWINIISLVLGVISIILGIDYFKKKRYPGKISFIELTTINLINDIAKNFDEIAILHNNRNVKENIIYYKGCFINTGDIDITGSLVEDNLSITFENYKWLKIKSTNSSKGLKCTARLVNETTVEFDFNLLRKNEFFEFEALIESGNDTAGELNPIIIHRIANTEKINRVDTISKKDLKNTMASLMASLLVLLLSVIISCAVIYGNLTSTYTQLYYLSKNKNGETKKFTVQAHKPNKIILTDVDSCTDSTISLAEFQNKENYIPVIYDEKQNSLALISFAIIFNILLLFIYPVGRYLKFKKQKRILEILSISK